MNPPKAILFDLDDTLLAWSDTYPAAWASLCSRHVGDPEIAARFPGQILSHLIGIRNGSDIDPSDHVVTAVERSLSDFDIPGSRDLAVRMAASHNDERVEVSTLLPGAIHTLEYFRKKGVRLAILTSGSAEAQRRKVVRHGLEKHFDTILIEGELGYGKPEERIYHEALDQLGVEASDTWTVGDGLEWDLETALKLGVFSVWVVWPGSKYVWMGLPPDAYPENSSVKPDLIVRRVTELMDS